MLKEVQQLALWQRFENRNDLRSERLGALGSLLAGADVDPRRVEPLGRQLERARLLHRSDLSREIDGGPTVSRKVFEAVIGRDDRLPRNFLADGATATNAVCRVVSLMADGAVSFGTGFSIGPGLIMTNNHVLPSPEIAARSLVQFGYFLDSPSSDSRAVSVRLNPNDLFITNIQLDFTVVSLDRQLSATVYELFGAINLLPRSGKALTGEAVNVIQHGDGQPQTVSIRDNVVVDVFDDWVHYTSDTSAGASGSPVLNDQWQLAALHHAAIEHRAQNGRMVVINEGVRISSIFRKLESNLP
ncbi:serine protease [Nocardia rhamnosiphila]|uniref:trypsin-like serine peptidase n=1 Tax=Nocardia rhamnosiphila TaxID=426716 RepID=UPI0033BFE144